MATQSFPCLVSLALRPLCSELINLFRGICATAYPAKDSNGTYSFHLTSCCKAKMSSLDQLSGWYLEKSRKCPFANIGVATFLMSNPLLTDLFDQIKK